MKIVALSQNTERDGYDVTTSDGVVHFVSNAILENGGNPIAIDASGDQNYTFKDDEKNEAIEFVHTVSLQSTDGDAATATILELQGTLAKLTEDNAMLQRAVDEANTTIGSMRNEIETADATIDSLQRELAELRVDIPAKLREAADHMEGKDHPSKPAVANLDDMPSLDKLPAHKPLDESSSS